MTKIWCRAANEVEFTEARIASEEWFDPGIGVSVFDCKRVPGPFPDVTLELRWRHPPADYFEPGTLFTVSDRLKAVLEEFDVRAEFFPLRVTRRGKEYTERTFYFCNILDAVDCLDRTRGSYTFWDKPGFKDHVDKIIKLAIDEEKAAGHDLFRIAKGGECIVCASDRLATRIAERRFTGVRLIAPEDWSFGCVVDD